MYISVGMNRYQAACVQCFCPDKETLTTVSINGDKKEGSL